MSGHPGACSVAVSMYIHVCSAVMSLMVLTDFQPLGVWKFCACSIAEAVLEANLKLNW